MSAASQQRRSEWDTNLESLDETVPSHIRPGPRPAARDYGVVDDLCATGPQARTALPRVHSVILERYRRGMENLEFIFDVVVVADVAVGAIQRGSPRRVILCVRAPSAAAAAKSRKQTLCAPSPSSRRGR